jgi:DNA repair photolyase
VCAEYRNPVHIITKAPLIERDLELLARLARDASISVSISIPFWNEAHARSIEPYVATPARRIKTVRRLHESGIRVSVNVAPVIPGLNDDDMPTILEHAKAAGAAGASMIVVRLPGTVKEVFEQRIRKELPLRAERILARTREVRGGKLNDPRFGHRQTGEGVYAEMVTRLFERTADRLGLVGRRAQASEPCTTATFQRPATAVLPKSPRVPSKNLRETAQLDLFGDRAGPRDLGDRRR